MIKDKYTRMDKTSTDKTLVGWSNRLRNLGLNEIASKYDTDIIRDFYLIRELNLPTYDSYMFSVVCFLDQFERLQANFIHDSYYLILLPMHENYRKYILMDFKSLLDAKNFIVQNIQGMYEHYMIRISEFEQNVYGGSIISDEGLVLVEMVKGLQNGVAYGTKNVISGRLTPFTISTHYSTSNEEERLYIWRVIQSIIQNNDMITQNDLINRENHFIHNINFLKGYFEFVYTKHMKRDCLRLIFFDVKLNKAYYHISPFA